MIDRGKTNSDEKRGEQSLDPMVEAFGKPYDEVVEREFRNVFGKRAGIAMSIVGLAAAAFWAFAIYRLMFGSSTEEQHIWLAIILVLFPLGIGVLIVKMFKKTAPSSKDDSPK